jgi:hypothetical protein
MVLTDFPLAWPDLLKDLIAKLQNANSNNELFGILLSLKTISEVFEFVQVNTDKRATLKLIIGQVYPFYENLILGQINNWNAESPMLMNLILKSITNSSRIDVNDYFATPEKLDLWMKILARILHLPFLDQSLSALAENSVSEIDKKQKSCEWKTRINASNILVVFFNFSERVTLRAKATTNVDTSTWQHQLSENFLHNYSLNFVEAFYKLLEGNSQNQNFLPPLFVINILRS